MTKTNIQTPAGDISAKSGIIRFAAHHSGTLNTIAGITNWGYLPAIFALSSTRKAYDRTIGAEPFQTDAAGLRRLETIAEEAEDSIVDAVELVGILLANVNADELDPYVINRVGWLLAGLSELRRGIAGTRADATYHLSEMGCYAAGGDHG